MRSERVGGWLVNRWNTGTQETRSRVTAVSVSWRVWVKVRALRGGCTHLVQLSTPFRLFRPSTATLWRGGVALWCRRRGSPPPTQSLIIIFFTSLCCLNYFPLFHTLSLTSTLLILLLLLWVLYFFLFFSFILAYHIIKHLFASTQFHLCFLFSSLLQIFPWSTFIPLRFQEYLSWFFYFFFLLF